MQGFTSYLNKLCDDALQNMTASLCSEVISHQVSHSPNPTRSNGNLEEVKRGQEWKQEKNEWHRNGSLVFLDDSVPKLQEITSPNSVHILQISSVCAHPVSCGVGQNRLCHSLIVILSTQLLRGRLNSYRQGQAASMTHHPVHTRHVRCVEVDTRQPRRSPQPTECLYLHLRWSEHTSWTSCVNNCLIINTNPGHVAVRHSSAPPLTGRHTAHQHSLLRPYELHPASANTHTCTHRNTPDRHRFCATYLQSDMTAQNQLFVNHILSLTSFSAWDQTEIDSSECPSVKLQCGSFNMYALFTWLLVIVCSEAAVSVMKQCADNIVIFSGLLDAWRDLLRFSYLVVSQHA